MSLESKSTPGKSVEPPGKFIRNTDDMVLRYSNTPSAQLLNVILEELKFLKNNFLADRQNQDVKLSTLDDFEKSFDMIEMAARHLCADALISLKSFENLELILTTTVSNNIAKQVANKVNLNLLKSVQSTVNPEKVNDESSDRQQSTSGSTEDVNKDILPTYSVVLQSSETSTEELIHKLPPSSTLGVKLGGIFKNQNKIVLKTKSKNEADILENTIKAQVPSYCQVYRGKPTCNRYIVHNLGKEECEQFQDILRKNINAHEEDVISVKHFLSNNTLGHFIFDVNARFQSKIESNNAVILDDYKVVKIKTYKDVTRCKKCQQIGHTSLKCMNKKRCHVCSENDCSGVECKTEKCLNCFLHNRFQIKRHIGNKLKDYKLRDIFHSPNSSTCRTYQEYKQEALTTFDYSRSVYHIMKAQKASDSVEEVKEFTSLESVKTINTLASKHGTKFAIRCEYSMDIPALNEPNAPMSETN